MADCLLLDERTRPDFREIYGRHASRAEYLDAAVRRVRLGGMDLDRGEIGGIRRLRLIVGEMNALALASEADALAADRARRDRLVLLLELLAEERLCPRLAPLAGWSPDFSIFRSLAPDSAPVLLIGHHWFERPFPHPGPAFGVMVSGDEAVRGEERFEEIWRNGHAIRSPIESILRDALARTA